MQHVTGRTSWALPNGSRTPYWGSQADMGLFYSVPAKYPAQRCVALLRNLVFQPRGRRWMSPWEATKWHQVHLSDAVATILMPLLIWVVSSTHAAQDSAAWLLGVLCYGFTHCFFCMAYLHNRTSIALLRNSECIQFFLLTHAMIVSKWDQTAHFLVTAVFGIILQPLWRYSEQAHTLTCSIARESWTPLSKYINDPYGNHQNHPYCNWFTGLHCILNLTVMPVVIKMFG